MTMTESSTSPTSLEHILDTVDVSPDTFLQPSASLQAAALVAAKRILDPIMSEYSVFRELALKGLDVEQVWEQIQLVGDQLKSELNKLGKQNGNGASVDNGLRNREDLASEGSVMDEGTDSNTEEEGDEDETDLDELNEDEDMEDVEDISEGDEGSEDEEDEFPANPDLDDESDGEDDSTAVLTAKPFKKDVHGLNDEFFSIDDFNRLTEQQDITRSDDEEPDEIDYFGGNLALNFPNFRPG